MEIRLANWNDLAELAGLKRWGPEQPYRGRIAATEEGRCAYLVAELDRRIVGQALLKYEGTPEHRGYPDVEDLYVREDRRGSGVGTALLSRCEYIAGQRGFQRLGLSVNPTLNYRAKALYERLGFRDVGRPPYLDGVYDGVEDWVIDMVKDLFPMSR